MPLHNYDNDKSGISGKLKTKMKQKQKLIYGNFTTIFAAEKVENVYNVAIVFI